jgi:hypothetical protein
MSRQPTAPRERMRPCRICGKPDYLEDLCWRHYRELKRVCSICGSRRMKGDTWDQKYEAHQECAADLEYERVEDVRDKEDGESFRG